VVIEAKPDVFNHNLRPVPRLYLRIRPGARYYHSLRLLERVKERDPSQFTKSGVMVGLGETKEEVMQVMDDMRSGRRRLHHHRPVPAAHAPARRHRPLRRAGRVQGAGDHRAGQGLPDGQRQPADPLLAPRGRRLRPAAAGAGSAAAEPRPSAEAVSAGLRLLPGAAVRRGRRTCAAIRSSSHTYQHARVGRGGGGSRLHDAEGGGRAWASACFRESSARWSG
jgi:hypothetical protein